MRADNTIPASTRVGAPTATLLAALILPTNISRSGSSRVIATTAEASRITRLRGHSRGSPPAQASSQECRVHLQAALATGPLATRPPFGRRALGHLAQATAAAAARVTPGGWPRSWTPPRGSQHLLQVARSRGP